MRRVSIIIIFLQSLIATAQSEYYQSVLNHQDSVNMRFADSATSILPEVERLIFQGLDFFEPNDSFRIKGLFKEKRFKRCFKMETSTDRKPKYRVYGIFTFELNGETHTLEIYQNMRLRKKKGYENYLFCPFKDLTCGGSSYGGGRYLDFTIDQLKSDPLVDFNFSYNPYCTYNYKYSCPVPPVANHLKVHINAGIKNFEHLTE